MSMFLTRFRSPPFGPCCSRGECMEGYHAAQQAAPEAQKKAAQLEKDKSALEEQHRRTEEAFAESMAMAQADNEREKRAKESALLANEQLNVPSPSSQRLIHSHIIHYCVWS